LSSIKSLIPLDEYEKELINYLNEKESFNTLSPLRRKKLQEMAKKSLEIKKEIKIEIEIKELQQLKKRAKSLNIPYTTLINNLITQYLKEQNS